MGNIQARLTILFLGAFLLALASAAIAEDGKKSITIEEKKTGKKLQITICEDAAGEPADVKSLEEAQRNLHSVQQKDTLEKELTNLPGSFYDNLHFRIDEELELILRNPPKPNPENLRNGPDYSDFPSILIRYPVKVRTAPAKHASTKATAKDPRRRSLAARGGYTRKVVEIDISPIILKYAVMYDVDPWLVKAIIEVESNYRPLACSRAGARGLMQLMPRTAARLGVKDIYDPEQNIAGGTRYIKAMLDHFNNDPQLAIAAYNAGPGSVQKYKGIPPYQETQRYVVKVLNAWGKK
jgi:hypothetical protein